MLYVATEPFFCHELCRNVLAGDTVDLTVEQAKHYKAIIRRVTMRSPKKRRTL